jgi:uncharacterized protein involved in exopolysaccharide biosynthesis
METSPPVRPTDPDDEEIDLGALLVSLISRVLRHKAVVVVVFLLVIAGAFAVALLSQPFYSCTTKLVYQTAGGGASSSLSSLAALAGVSTGAASDPSAYLQDIVTSTPTMEAMLARKWKVSDTSLTQGADSATLETIWKVEPDTTQPNWETAKFYGMLKRLQKGSYITYAQDKKSGLITITTEFEDPQVAYDANLFLMEELNNTLVNKMNFKASENRKFVESRLDEVKEALRGAENDLRRFRERNRLRQDPADQLEDDRRQREVLIQQELFIQLQKQFEMAKIEEVRDLPVIDVIDPPLLPIEKSKPKRRMIVMAGGVAAVFFALLAAVALDLWQEKRGVLRQMLKGV